MTLREIKTLVVSADPDIRHYFSEEKGRDYSYWEEIRRLAFMSDDRHEEAWRFAVHRFTRAENDPVAKRILDVLDGDDRVAVAYEVAVQDDGWIHHIYICEGL